MLEAASADAPGRVNLIGEHTDYHEGFVLPTIIPQRTWSIVRRRPDRRVRARSGRQGETWDAYELGHEQVTRRWIDYVQGVTATIVRAGHAIPGFDLEVESTVPVGAGVSSSAALSVSILRALRTLAGLRYDDVELARMAQQVETDFVGAPVGIMDPLVSSLGHNDEALFIDTRSLEIERIPMPASMEIRVIDSGIAHRHAGGGYVARRRESFEAAAALGVHTLRDVDEHATERIATLPPVLARRARHVVTENQRVLDAVAAIRANDPRRFGALLLESHASLRDEYEVTTPEIDTLVRLAARHQAVFGCRMTGGGFGGAIVLLVQPGSGLEAVRDVIAEYASTTGQTATRLV
jgi:galactokinase